MLSIYRSAVVFAVLALVALAGIVFFGSGTADAAPGEHTSCMGHEASDISPPGSNPEAPAGVPDLLAFVDSLGAPSRGAVISSLAHLHEGSHAACDEATE